MRKVWAVIRREFVERVRQKWFWVMTILGPVLFAAMVFLPALLIGRGGVRNLALVDETTAGFGQNVATALARNPRFHVSRVAAASGVIDSLTAEVGAKRLHGFLIVSDGLLENGTAEYRASNVSAIRDLAELERALNRVVVTRRLERQGVNPAVVDRAQVNINLATKKISGTKTTGESAGQTFALAYFMAMILYMAIVLYGMSVMTSVLEEKTTRIVEVLASSLRPGELLMGKLLGVGAVSLFQFGLWAVSAKLLISQRAALMGRLSQGEEMSFFQLPNVSTATALIALFFFFGGFFLYAAMFAAVGAISNNQQEAQQAQQPVTLMLVVALFSMFAMLSDPNSTFAVVASLVPFTSPIAMPVRWAAGSLRLSELLSSMALLVLAIVAVMWTAARIYRVGILMTGKRPSIKELVRWVRAA